MGLLLHDSLYTMQIYIHVTYSHTWACYYITPHMRKQTLVHTYAHIYTCTCVLYLSAVSWGKVDAGKYHITGGIVFMSLSARPCIYMKDNARHMHTPKAASGKKTELPWAGFEPVTSRVLDGCSCMCGCECVCIALE